MITLSGFQEALKKAKLPYTKHSIVKYERKGVISYPKTPMRFATRIDRAYTEGEIKENIRKIKEYKRTSKINGTNKGGRPRKQAALKTLNTHHGSKKNN